MRASGAIVCSGVIDGQNGSDGTSPYFADIDNEMMNVACDYQGKTTAAFDKTVNVNMWHGSSQQNLTKLVATLGTTSASATGSTNSTNATSGNIKMTVNRSSKTVRIEIANAKEIAQVSDIAITIACENSGDKTLHLCVNGVRPGSPGEKAVLYDLIPSASSVKCDKNNSLTPSSLTCDVQRSEGASVSRATSSHGTLYYRKNGDIASASDGTSLAINTGSVSLAATDTYVTFAFFDANGTLRDKERIPVVKDGSDGNDAADVQPNILLRTIFDRGLDFVKEAWTSGGWGTSTCIDAATDTVVNGRKSIRLNASSLSSVIDFQQDVYGRIKTSTWYTLSFNYFATQAFYTFIWDGNNSHGIVDTSAGYYLDGVFYNSSLGIDGNHQWPASWTGARHSITFKTKSSFGTTHANVLFRCPAGGQVAICMPKLEEGKSATAYMPHEDDLRGLAGSSGKMCYIAGEYDATIEYKSNDNETVAVEVPVANSNKTQLWLLAAATNVVNGVHIAPTDAGQTVWERGLNDYSLLRTKYLFAAFASLGSFIVSGDFFISQYGTLFTSANDTTGLPVYSSGQVYNGKACYMYFREADPMAEDSTISVWPKFRPTKCLNALTGEEWSASGNVHTKPNGDVIFKKSLFSNYAQFGSAIIEGDWLISVCGTINGLLYEGSAENPAIFPAGSNVPVYTYFDPNLPDYYEFLPANDNGQNGFENTSYSDSEAVKVNSFHVTAGRKIFLVRCDCLAGNTYAALFKNGAKVDGTEIVFEAGGADELFLAAYLEEGYYELRAYNDVGMFGYLYGMERYSFKPNYALNLREGISFQRTGVLGGFSKKEKIVITTANLNQYKRTDITSAVILDFSKCGSYIELQYGVPDNSIVLPLLNSELAGRYSVAQKADIRGYIGSRLLIYNAGGSSRNFVTKRIPASGTTNSTTISTTLGAWCFINLECVIESDSNGKELIYWKVLSTGTNV